MVRSIGCRLFTSDMRTRYSFNVRKSSPRLMRGALSRLKLLAIHSHRPGALSKKRGRHMTMTIDVVYKGRILMFSRPASNLSCSDVRRIDKLVQRLSGSGIVFIIARSCRFIYRAYAQLVEFSRRAVAGSVLLSRRGRTAVLSLVKLKESRE